jgi:hypothetical protein
MQFGSPEFVLAIIGMAMFAGVMKTAVRAKHGLPEDDCSSASRRRGRRSALETPRDDGSAQVVTLKAENKRLTDQVETMQDRLIVLEKIVTDRGYTLASEIEALRDRGSASAPSAKSEIQ